MVWWSPVEKREDWEGFAHRVASITERGENCKGGGLRGGIRERGPVEGGLIGGGLRGEKNLKDVRRAVTKARSRMGAMTIRKGGEGPWLKGP